MLYVQIVQSMVHIPITAIMKTQKKTRTQVPFCNPLSTSSTVVNQ